MFDFECSRLRETDRSTWSRSLPLGCAEDWYRTLWDERTSNWTPHMTRKVLSTRGVAPALLIVLPIGIL
jgi:hypothetical protein